MQDSRNTIHWNKLGRLGLLAQAAAVGAVVLVVWVMVATVAYKISGILGVLAAAAGAGACLLGAEFALAIGSLFRGPAAPVFRVMFGMMARTMVPLALGVALHLQVPWLAEAGFIFYLLFFYMATLAVETALLLAQVPHHATSKKTV